jgi:hypothetical protein
VKSPMDRISGKKKTGIHSDILKVLEKLIKKIKAEIEYLVIFTIILSAYNK